MIRILIIDENPASNEHIKSLMAKTQGVGISAANDGLEAIDLFKLGHEFDIIFLDWEMHTLSGMRTFEEIRKLGISTPMIKMSKKGPFTEERDGFLIKPLKLENLIKKIEVALGVKIDALVSEGIVNDLR